MKNQLKALENEQASQRTQMMQLFGDVDKRMQADRKAVEQAHGVLKNSLEDLGKNTESQVCGDSAVPGRTGQSYTRIKGRGEAAAGRIRDSVDGLRLPTCSPRRRRKSESSDADMRGGMTPLGFNCDQGGKPPPPSSSPGSSSEVVNLVL